MSNCFRSFLWEELKTLKRHSKLTAHLVALAFCQTEVKLRFYEKATKFLQNHHRKGVLCSKGQTYSGDLAKFFGLLRIYELYKSYRIICNNQMFWI